MSGDAPLKKAVFDASAPADVVNNLELSLAARYVCHQTDMRQVVVESPRDNIAGFIVCTVCGDRNGFAFALEVGHQVWDAAMVNVGVGLFESPAIRIGGEVARHIF